MNYMEIDLRGPSPLRKRSARGVDRMAAGAYNRRRVSDEATKTNFSNSLSYVEDQRG